MAETLQNEATISRELCVCGHCFYFLGKYYLKKENTGLGSAVVLLGAVEKPAFEKVASVQVEEAGAAVVPARPGEKPVFQVEPFPGRVCPKHCAPTKAQEPHYLLVNPGYPWIIHRSSIGH